MPDTSGQEYHGRTGLWLESYGSLTTDIYGLSTGTATFVSPASYPQWPQMLSPHPFFSFLHMEKRQITIEAAFVRTVGEYAGFEGDPLEVTEWSSGMAEEPIQTHPDFETSIAGKPSAPLHGAVFLDGDGQVSQADGLAWWARFAGPDRKAGVTSYLSPCLIKRVTQLSRSLIVVANIGHIEGGMLKVAASCVQRGIVFQNTQEWRGAGRRGWDPDIYH